MSVFFEKIKSRRISKETSFCYICKNPSNFIKITDIMKKISASFFFCLTLLVAASCNCLSISSPDGTLEVTVSENGFVASKDGEPVQTVEFEAGQVKAPFFGGTVTESYELLAGSRKNCSSTAKTKLFHLSDNDMEVRVYDNAVAYRFLKGEKKVTYLIPEGQKRWMGSYGFSGYEAMFPESTSSRPGKWIYPALVEYRDGLFGFIAEAGIERDHSCSMLSTTEDQGRYELVTTDAEPEYEVTPWRFIIVGTLADVAESTIVTDLSAPCRLEDTSWIEPGVSSWIYWAYNHGSKDFGIICNYIDLAVEMGWPYCLVDWEWPQMEGGKTIEDVMAYAKEKGVKINLWYNSGTSWVGEGAPQPEDKLRTPESREAEFAWLESLGVSGVKVDFFAEDGAEMVNYYIDILEDAAKHHLLVDFHGSTIPRGWQRTYPNLMSVEAVYGAEWYNNVPFFTPRAASHNATLPFTRGVMGPMDYTPCTFTDSQHPHITTGAHELALPVLFQSSLQHMADRPEGYLGQTEDVRELLSELPATWDETRLLGGYPGEYVVMARRSGDRWYVAAINGTDNELTLSADLSAIVEGDCDVTLFSDSEDGKSIEARKTNTASIELVCLPRGGFVALVENK